jgi:hypothetical protein
MGAIKFLAKLLGHCPKITAKHANQTQWNTTNATEKHSLTDDPKMRHSSPIEKNAVPKSNIPEPTSDKSTKI